MSKLAARLSAALQQSAGLPPILPGDLGRDEVPNPKPAAVLIAITDQDRPGLVLTRRTDSLRAHAGQVAFPGGRVDAEDDSIEAAALREAWEEIALLSTQVNIIGTLDPYYTGTGYTVTPVIGVIPPGLSLYPHEAEVAEIFEIPLDHALNPAHHKSDTVEWKGRMRTFYVIDWPDQYIWGATAGMIVNLSQRLAGWRA